MDFPVVLRTVSDWFESKDVDFALIGGVALAAYGYPRLTLDLDFVVDAGAQDELIELMEAEGYETLHRSAGYSNHLSVDRELGRVDFVYVRGETRSLLFSQALRLPGPGGLEVPVAKPEHLIAMKITAMKNDPDRVFQDLADIHFLLSRPGIDIEAVRSRFEREGMEERFRELTRGL